jgi:hypothetical protein
MIINEIYYNIKYNTIAMFSTIGGIGVVHGDDWVFIDYYIEPLTKGK